MERLEAGGPDPPRVKRLAQVVEGDADLLHDLLTLLEREDRVVAVSPDLYLARPVEERLRRRARRLLEEHEGPVPLSDFKDAFGTSRSYLIPLLEHFDRIGMTRRTGEGRVLAVSEATGQGPDREEVA
jgi:selenocysteine-specific elongation factor